MDENEALKRAIEKAYLEGDGELGAFRSGWKDALEWRDSQTVPVARVQHGNAGCIYWLPQTNALKLPDQVLLYLQKPTKTG